MRNNITSQLISKVNVEEELKSRIIGQNGAIEKIVPFIEVYNSGLSVPNRPAASFFITGPTGVGKTKLVETLAEIIHLDKKNVLFIDCGEYQMEHEVAKLIGAPPGYLGHRETQPAITQQKLNAVKTDKSNLSIVLFDEVEKGAASLHRILLGILDRGVLRLGDSGIVNFDNSIIFFTSNIGSHQMQKAMAGGYGFNSGRDTTKQVGLSEMKKKFPPEFINRLDEILFFNSLTEKDIEGILDLELNNIVEHIKKRYNENFELFLTKNARMMLISESFSNESGARELKRVIQKKILQPIAKLIIGEKDGEKQFSLVIRDNELVILREKEQTMSA